MPNLPSPLLNALSQELGIVRDHAVRLETLVSVGALASGHEAVLDAQSLDYVLQALDSLAKLFSDLATEAPLEHAIMCLPLSQMAKRLNADDRCSANLDPHISQTHLDPEMF
jgi:hypothetical protein